MAIEELDQKFSSEQLATAAWRLLDASTLCALATLTPEMAAHVNTAYFSWSRELDIVWISDPEARHSANLRANPSVAIAVFDSTQTWDKEDRGIQLFGSARELAGKAVRRAEVLYASRFPKYARWDMPDFRLYRFHPHRIKLFDETTLGSSLFVTARVRPRGGLEWEKTELYHPSSGPWRKRGARTSSTSSG